MGGPCQEPQNSGVSASLSRQREARGGVVRPEGLRVQQILVLTIIVMILQVKLLVL